MKTSHHVTLKSNYSVKVNNALQQPENSYARANVTKGFFFVCTPRHVSGFAPHAYCNWNDQYVDIYSYRLSSGVDIALMFRVILIIV